MVQKYIGEDVKLTFYVEPIDDTDLSGIDWSIEIWCTSNKVLTFKKEEAIDVGNGQYAVCFNTKDIGEGIAQLRINYNIPDEDFEDGVRNEFDIYKIMKIVKP